MDYLLHIVHNLRQKALDAQSKHNAGQPPISEILELRRSLKELEQLTVPPNDRLRRRGENRILLMLNWGLSDRAASAVAEWDRPTQIVALLTRKQLLSLPKVGPVLADEIIDKRAAVFAAKQQ